MTTIISERHFFKFYIALFFIDLFWGLMSLATGALYNEGSTLFGKIIMIAMSAGLAFMVFYTIFRYYKNAPRIVVNDNSISFNSDVYYWRDLEKIEMTGKRPFKFMGERKEGVLLKFKGEKERYIFDDMYENTPEIKSLIEAVTSEKVAPAEVTDSKMVDTNFATHHPTTINSNAEKPALHLETIINMGSVAAEEQTSDNIKWFKGFPLISFDGILFGGLILLFLSFGMFEFLSHHHISSIIGMSIFSLIIFLLICYRWHYFGISGSDLVIKNYNFPWVKKDYSLSNIKEIVFERTAGRAATTRMRIIMKDFSTKKYPAATLWSKKWLELKADLENKGVKVRNECVYYEPFEFKFFNN